MSIIELCETIFAHNYQITQEENVITGSARFQTQEFILLGVINNAQLDCNMSIKLASFLLNLPDKCNGLPILFFVDTGGQKVSHHAELLGLNSYLAHLIKVIQFRKSVGHKIFALVYGNALGGAFIATGLNANYVFATKESQIAVMWLEAMSKVTKIPLTTLQDLSKTSPIFAPGADNFAKLGAVEEVILVTDFLPKCLNLLHESDESRHWQELAYSRGGRIKAKVIIDEILQD